MTDQAISSLINTTNKLGDLRDFVSSTTGPYFTAVIPARSDVADAAHRFEVRWANARRELEAEWPEATLSRADEVIASVSHGDGAALAVVVASGGETFSEFLSATPAESEVRSGKMPALVPIIENRQRTLPHVLVDADKSGATVMTFDAGDVVDVDRVEGEEYQIHRGHPGGWSQRRFQQRAENTWETNADDVAETVADAARTHDAQLIAVAGPVRARSMVIDALADRDLGDITAAVEAGDADGIAAETVRLVDDRHARMITGLLEQLRDGAANGLATTTTEATLDALVEGRVEALLVDDDWSDETTIERQLMDIEPGARLIDAAVEAALRTDATIVSVPSVSTIDGPIAAILRW